MIWDLISGLAVLGGVAIIGGWLTLWACRLLAAWLRARQDAYDPQFAEAPESDAAFADVQRVFAGQFDAQGDLLAPADYQPSVAAASDLDDSKLVGEIYQAIDLYKRGGDIESGAPTEQA